MAKRSIVSVAAGIAAITALGFACSSFEAEDGGSAVVDGGGGTDGLSPSADGTPSGTHPYVQAVLADGPVGYFRFEEEPLTARAASSEILGGTAGTLQGDATRSAEGVLPSTRALLLSGTGYATVSQAFDFVNNEPFTLEAWVRSAQQDNSYRMIFTKQLYGDAGGQWDVHNVYLQDDRIGFERYVGGQELVVSGSPVKANQWTHVAATYDGGTVRIYLDGAMVESKPDTRKAVSKPNPFAIGGDPSVDHFIGLIDEVAIYDKALTADRIKAHVDAAAR